MATLGVMAGWHSCEGVQVELRERGQCGMGSKVLRECAVRIMKHKHEQEEQGKGVMMQLQEGDNVQTMHLHHRDDVVSHGATCVEVLAQTEWDCLLVSITNAERGFVQRLLQLVDAIVPTIAPACFYKQSGHAQKLHPTYNVDKMFYRQEQAFQCYDALSCTDTVKIFSFESPITGTRKFLVMSFPLFLSRYCNSAADARHVYEIIREDQPCRAYFDLEYHVPSNPEVDGEVLTCKWKELVAKKVNQLFGMELQGDSFVELDSSTTEKFSRHITLRLPEDRLFRSNIEVGKFVAAVLAQKPADIPEQSTDCEPQELETPMKRARTTDALDGLLVLSKSGEKQSFVDTSVYTKNRAFRLFLSRKFGKAATLTMTPSCKLQLFPNINEATTFRHMVERILQASFAAPLDATARNEESLLTVPDFDLDPQLHHLLPAVGPRPTYQLAGSLSGTSNSPSPFPAIDRLIESVANKGGVQGQIRDWKYTVSKLADDASRLITYQIAHNRWCDNIRRAHKSNHILFVVDLGFGIYFQKCMDSECRAMDYRSPAVPVPADILPTLDYLKDVDFECAISAAVAEEPEKWQVVFS